MNQYKKRAFLWVLVLTVCAILLGGCINPTPGDFHTTVPDTTAAPSEITIPTTPEETTPTATKPQETTTIETITTEKPTTETTTESTTPQETTTQETTTEQNTDTPVVEKIKIYIDQGHNPFSPTHPPSWNTGASNEALGLYEQDLTFEIGMLLAALLVQDDHFEVRLSRPTPETILGTDQSSALDARINDAEAWGADYFISLHINDFPSDPSVSGLELCHSAEGIIGKELGTALIDGLATSTGLRKRSPKLRNDIRVLMNTTMPSTLVEMGFISNEDDAILLRDNPELFAQGLYNGIQSYFDFLETGTNE